jgi:hypothetical protein
MGKAKGKRQKGRDGGWERRTESRREKGKGKREKGKGKREKAEGKRYKAGELDLRVFGKLRGLESLSLLRSPSPLSVLPPTPPPPRLLFYGLKLSASTVSPFFGLTVKAEQKT